MFLSETDQPVEAIVDTLDPEVEWCWPADQRKLCLIQSLPLSSASILRERLACFDPDQKISPLKFGLLASGRHLLQQLSHWQESQSVRCANTLLILDAVRKSPRRSRADCEEALICAWCTHPEDRAVLDLFKKYVNL